MAGQIATNKFFPGDTIYIYISHDCSVPPLLLGLEKIELVLLSRGRGPLRFDVPQKNFFGTAECKGVPRYCIDSANKTSRLVGHATRTETRTKATSLWVPVFISQSQTKVRREGGANTCLSKIIALQMAFGNL